jgi:hypothetical protein
MGTKFVSHKQKKLTMLIGKVDVDSVIIQQQTDDALVAFQVRHRHWRCLKGEEHTMKPI